MLKITEVEDDDRADEEFEDHEETALRDKIGLAGLVDKLGDIAHRLMHRHVLQLAVNQEPEHKSERRDEHAAE